MAEAPHPPKRRFERIKTSIDDSAVRTIQKFIDARMDYGFWCRDCQRHLSEFSLYKIVDRVGADFDLYSGKRLPVKCAECGGKNLDVVIGGAGTLKPLP